MVYLQFFIYIYRKIVCSEGSRRNKRLNSKWAIKKFFSNFAYQRICFQKEVLHIRFLTLSVFRTIRSEVVGAAKSAGLLLLVVLWKLSVLLSACICVPPPPTVFCWLKLKKQQNTVCSYLLLLLIRKNTFTKIVVISREE